MTESFPPKSDPDTTMLPDAFTVTAPAGPGPEVLASMRDPAVIESEEQRIEMGPPVEAAVSMNESPSKVTAARVGAVTAAGDSVKGSKLMVPAEAVLTTPTPPPGA